MKRLLIANRGEIARRIIRTCDRLGIETVAVFSDVDGEEAFVSEATIAVALGGDTPASSYLRLDAVIDAIETSGADTVHPGYGFLSENADFARAVTEAGATFVGPPADVIAAMGSKIEAKRMMADAGVPQLAAITIDGDRDGDLDPDAVDLPYPLLVKASAGGGGRGMRVVAGPEDLADAVAAARREAASAFGDDTVFIERYVERSRHVEVQIVGDRHGGLVHLHERECSVQRRHQKVIEEAPCTTIEDDTRRALHDAAITAGRAVGYQNAGTVEFLVTDDGEIAFLEMNTRLQVEHPVTEAVLGMDLVELQLAVADGEPVPTQDEIGVPRGHAVEARLYAEDPTDDYRPSTGTVRRLAFPAGVRVDAALSGAGKVSQFYDPMVAKVIAHDRTRAGAAGRLATALRHAHIDGIATNRALLVRTLEHAEWQTGEADTSFLERHEPTGLGGPLVGGDDLDRYAAAAALAGEAADRAADPHTATVASGFRNVVTQPQRRVYRPRVGPELAVDYRFDGGRLVEVAVNGAALADPVLWSRSAARIDLQIAGLRTAYDVVAIGDQVSVLGPAGTVDLDVVPRFTDPTERVAPGSLVATMPGTVVDVARSVGDRVDEGDPVLVLEAMKMELTVGATISGRITEIDVAVGDNVGAGTVLAVIAAPDEDGA